MTSSDCSRQTRQQRQRVRWHAQSRLDTSNDAETTTLACLPGTLRLHPRLPVRSSTVPSKRGTSTSRLSVTRMTLERKLAPSYHPCCTQKQCGYGRRSTASLRLEDCHLALRRPPKGRAGGRGRSPVHVHDPRALLFSLKAPQLCVWAEARGMGEDPSDLPYSNVRPRMGPLCAGAR